MGTAIGIIVGIVVTVLVSRYYFLRSISKRLGIYTLHDSMVFSGIAPDVRGRLNFIFQNRPVQDLQQIIFLVANSGERAISNIMEPLAFDLSGGVEVLDASILHRSPGDLTAAVAQVVHQSGGSKVQINFPLLNKGDFFVVKFLLSGRLETKNIKFSILADDIPRSLRSGRLPPDAVSNKKYKIEWSLAVVSLFFLMVPAWAWCILYSLFKFQPSLFPYPWSTFVVNWESVFILVFGAFFLLIDAFVGIGLFAAAFFNGQFPPRRGPHFPLPKELQGLFSPISGLFEDEDLAAFKIEKN